MTGQPTPDRPPGEERVVALMQALADAVNEAKKRRDARAGGVGG